MTLRTAVLYQFLRKQYRNQNGRRLEVQQPCDVEARSGAELSRGEGTGEVSREGCLPLRPEDFQRRSIGNAPAVEHSDSNRQKRNNHQGQKAWP